MIQKFLCPKCGNTFDVPVEGFDAGATEVDCPCGASMVPSGGLEMEPEVPPHRDRLLQKRRRVYWIWQIIAIILVVAFLWLALFAW